MINPLTLAKLQEVLNYINQAIDEVNFTDCADTTADGSKMVDKLRAVRNNFKSIVHEFDSSCTVARF